MAAGARQILQEANQATVQAQAHSVAVNFQAENRVAFAEQAMAKQSQELSAVQQEAHTRFTYACGRPKGSGLTRFPTTSR